MAAARKLHRWIVAHSTVRDFSAAVGVSTQATYNWISGKARPDRERAVRIEAVTAGAVTVEAWG